MVGIGTGLAGVVFILACQIVMYFALWVGVGYKTTKPTNEHPPTWIEDPPAWMPQPRQGIEPWLLLLIPTIGGVLCGAIIFSFAGGGRPRHRRRYRRLPRPQRDDPLPRPHRQDHRQQSPSVRAGRAALKDRSPRSAAASAYLRQPLPAQFASAPRPHGGRHGRRHRRHPPRSAGRHLFASEVLYWSSEFEPEVLMPAGLASVASYCTLGCFIEGGFARCSARRWKWFLKTPCNSAPTYSWLFA